MKNRILKVASTIVMAFILILVTCAFCMCWHTDTHDLIKIKPSCVDVGQGAIVCNDCNKEIELYEIPATGHPGTHANIVRSETCAQDGKTELLCNKCNEVLGVLTIPKLPHTFGQYKLIKNPTPTENGVEQAICSECLYEDNREYICQHIETEEKITKEPTCQSEGIEVIECKLCTKELKSNKLSKVEHKYDDNIITKYATPVDKGSRYKECIWCKHRVDSEYTIQMPGTYSVYIPGTGINHKITPATFTQQDVDRYSVVYCDTVWGTGWDTINYNNPFILGHKHIVMGPLYKTKIGQKIYVKLNNKIEVYEVFISEQARDTGSGIVGNVTGANIMKKYTTRTLHLYTCYGKAHGDGRWMVLAKLVDTVEI